MYLKDSTRKKKEKLVDEQLKLKCYDNALEIISYYKLKGYTMTKSRATKEYNLWKSDFSVLSCLVIKYPHYKRVSPIKLYLKKELKEKFEISARRKNKINELLMNEN